MDTEEAVAQSKERWELDPIAGLLAGTFEDSETGERLRVQTHSLAIEESLAGSEAELVTGLGFGRRLAVVSDSDTHLVLGDRVELSLAGAFQVQSIILPRQPAADAQTVERIRAAAPDADAFVVVGSGTLNDLVKRASALEGKPYAVFATAPSMNGYTSLTASISVLGHKATLPAQAPAGAFFDLAILASAPVRMTRAGLGDSICRSTAQADWLLSHLLVGTPYRELPFALLAEDETKLLEAAADVVAGNLQAMRVLVRTLVLSGFGTAIVGSSSPASQAEHLVSHYLDMFAPGSRPDVLHGEQVAVTTLSVERLQQLILDDPAPVFQPDRETEASFRQRYGDELGASFWAEFAPKALDEVRAQQLTDTAQRSWTDIAARLEKVLLPAGRMGAVLRIAGAPTRPDEIHLDLQFYREALLRGREIRNRFTILDIAAGSGRLHSLISSL